MRNFKTLLVWQKSHELVLEIYNITQDFPNEERFCLTSQIRRASTSIALNIAEGCGRKTEKEFANFQIYLLVLAVKLNTHYCCART